MVMILRKFYRDISGASLVEYALIAGTISIVAYGAYQTIGTTVVSKMQPGISALN